MKRVTIHTLPYEQVSDCLQKVEASERESLSDAVLFLRNMSCAGQVHPEFSCLNGRIQENTGLQLKTEEVEVAALSYATLCQMLGIGGTEILMIDAEGHDCRILQSMIEHCIAEENRHVHAWPDVIQFETMGHSNKVDDPAEHSTSEEDAIRSLESCGYVLLSTGNDTVMVHGASLSAESRLRDWMVSFSCDECGRKGEYCMPFPVGSKAYNVCWQCKELYWLFGPSVWERWYRVPVESAFGEPDLKVENVATSGDNLWAVGVDGQVVCYRSGSWEDLGGRTKIVSLSAGGTEVWGLDRESRLVHRVSSEWIIVPTEEKIQYVKVCRDGSAVLCVDIEHSVQVYYTADKRWQPVYGYLKQLAGCQGASEVYGINFYHQTYCWSWWEGWAHTDDFELIDISMSDDGYHIWAIDESTAIHYKAGKWGRWHQIPGKLAKVHVSRDGSKSLWYRSAWWLVGIRVLEIIRRCMIENLRSSYMRESMPITLSALAILFRAPEH